MGTLKCHPEDAEYEEMRRELLQDGNLALRSVLKQAECGNESALYFIGTAYLFGTNGLRADLQKAIYALREAANAGSMEASYYIAECLAFGIGTKENLDKAKRYYHFAAQSGDEALREAAMKRLRELKQQK